MYLVNEWIVRKLKIFIAMHATIFIFALIYLSDKTTKNHIAFIRRKRLIQEYCDQMKSENNIHSMKNKISAERMKIQKNIAGKSATCTIPSAPINWRTSFISDCRVWESMLDFCWNSLIRRRFHRFASRNVEWISARSTRRCHSIPRQNRGCHSRFSFFFFIFICSFESSVSFEI